MFDPLMGVIGTSCGLCDLPLNFDHYVRSPSLGMYKIFRSSGHGHTWEPDERPVHFDASEHAWLCDAVAVRTHPPGLLTGPIEDGTLRGNGERAVVGFGDEPAYHRYCHDLFGAPTDGEALLGSRGTYGWACAETYNGQLYDLRALVDHGKAWMLADPRTNARSRERIAMMLAEARRRRALRNRPETIAEMIAADIDWRGQILREDDEPRDIVRYRSGMRPELDCATYPALVWAMKEYGEGMCDPVTLDELETFERAVKTTVEADAGAILLMVTIGHGQLQLIMQARDEATTRARIEALPQGRVPLELDNELDATWNIFFTQLAR